MNFHIEWMARMAAMGHGWEMRECLPGYLMLVDEERDLATVINTMDLVDEDHAQARVRAAVDLLAGAEK